MPAPPAANSSAGPSGANVAAPSGTGTPTPPLGVAAVASQSTPPVGIAALRLSVPPSLQSYPTIVPFEVPRRRTLLAYAVVFVICALIYLFRQALTLGFVAFAIAYVFAPIVRRVERYSIPRPLAALFVLLTTTAIIAGVVSTLIPELLHQTEAFARSIPRYAAAIQHDWIPWIRSHWHLPLPPNTEYTFGQLGVEASSMAPRIGAVLTGTLEYGAVVVEYLVRALILLALTFYLLLDYETVLDHAFDLVPQRHRARATLVAHEIDDTLRHFVTGQLVVMAVLGFLYALGLGLVGVPAGWAIGVFAGLISFVPYLGFVTAITLALFMAALQGNGAGSIIAIVAVMTAVHVLDLTLITPRILGGRAKISPVVTILALVAGGSAFGFTGVLVAIPAASVARVLLRELIDQYKTTSFFTDGSENAALQSGPLSMPPALRTDPGLGAALVAPAAAPPAPIQPANNDPVPTAPRGSNA